MNLLELASKLVSFDTVSNRSSTAPIADFISNFLQNAGFRIEQYPYVNETDGLQKVNLIARKGHGNRTRLALSGHIDTVEFQGCWDHRLSSNPLKVLSANHQKYPEGILYGRGISDMKLFLAMAMMAGAAIKENELKRPFALCFTSDEEVGCLGARKLVKTGTQIADYVVIGEPTEMVPIYAHKGYVYPMFEFVGEKGHSSHPQNGVSVIPAVMEVLKRLEEFEEKLRTIVDYRFDPPFPTLNIGVLTTDKINPKTGAYEIKSSKNMFPEHCRMELEIRPVPGQDSDEVLNVLRGVVGSQIGKVRIGFRKTRRPTPPMETPRDSLIVKVVEQIAGKKAVTVAYNTEGGVFNRSGSKTVIWGPGSIRQAHTRDEFVSRKYFQEEIVAMYERLIRSMCYE